MARIRAWEEKALVMDDRRELELELKLGLRGPDERIERLPIARFRIWEAEDEAADSEGRVVVESLI